jgi:hypothetical protein
MEDEFNVPPRHIEDLLPSITVTFPFRVLLSKLSSIPADFTVLVGVSRYPCQSLVLASIFPVVRSALSASPDLTEFALDLPDSPDLPEILIGAKQSPPFQRLTLPNLLTTLSTLTPRHSIRTKTESYQVHALLFAGLCTTTISSIDTDLSLTEVAKYLCGESISVTSANLAIIQAGADLLGISSLQSVLSPIWDKFRFLGRTLAASSLQNWLNEISSDNFPQILEIVKNSYFFTSPADHFLLIELLLTAATVRPLLRHLHLDIFRDLMQTPDFLQTLTRYCLSVIGHSDAPHWMLRQLMKLGAFTIGDVVRILQVCPSSGFTYRDHEPSWTAGWYLPELFEHNRELFNHYVADWSGQHYVRGSRDKGNPEDFDCELHRRFLDAGFHLDEMITALRNDDVVKMEDLLCAHPYYDFEQPTPACPFDPMESRGPWNPPTPIKAVVLEYGAVRCFKSLVIRNVDFSNEFVKAFVSGNPEIIRVGEQKGAHWGRYHLYTAIAHQRNQIYRWLRETDPEIETREMGGPRFHRSLQDAMGAALQGNNLEVFLHLLETGVSKTEYSSPLRVAVSRGWSEILRVLLGREQPELLGQDPSGALPPTFLAVSDVPREIMRMLLDYPGVNVNYTDGRDRTLLGHAISRKAADVVRVLIERMNPEDVAREMAKYPEAELEFLKS